MKTLLAIALVAACGIAHAKGKPASPASATPASTEATEAAPKAVPRTEVAAVRAAAPKPDAYASRDPYAVPLLRDARSMR